MPSPPGRFQVSDPAIPSIMSMIQTNPSQWGLPQSTRTEPEAHFSRLSIFVVFSMSMILFVGIVKTLQAYRREWSFDTASDDLDLETGVDADFWWDGDPQAGSSTSTAPVNGSSQSIPDRPRDDTYEAAVASLVSLNSSDSEADREVEQDAYFLQYRVRDVRKFQRLVEKLKNASYLHENEPEGSPGRREIDQIRMQIAELVVDPASNVNVNIDANARRSSPKPELHVCTEPPPPAYQDVVSDEDIEAQAGLPPPLSPHQISPGHTPPMV